MPSVPPSALLRPGPLGLILPTFALEDVPQWAQPGGVASAGSDPVGTLQEICRQAEALGAEALWVCDHLFWHRPLLECTVALTVAALATERAQVGSCVIQLPLRHAPVVAKQAATLQTVSQGRLILGVGVGSHPGEYEVADRPYSTRGADLDAGIDQLRACWASGAETIVGDVVGTAAERYRMLPAPPSVPIWVGGSSEAALRRAARRGDGWMPLFLDVEQYAGAVARLRDATLAAGREAEDVVASVVVFVSVDDDVERARARGTAWMSTLYGLPPKAFGRHLVAGTAVEVAETVEAYREAGAEHVAVYVTADRPVEQFAAIVAARRAAVPTGT